MTVVLWCRVVYGYGLGGSIDSCERNESKNMQFYFRRKAVVDKEEVAYITSTHADVVDAYDNIVRVLNFRYSSIFILGLSWTV